MASLIVRNIPEDAKQKLRVRAATNGRSMEEEVRVMLEEGLRRPVRSLQSGKSWVVEMRKRMKSIGGGTIEVPSYEVPYTVYGFAEEPKKR
jgi:antitoxin FitA